MPAPCCEQNLVHSGVMLKKLLELVPNCTGFRISIILCIIAQFGYSIHYCTTIPVALPVAFQIPDSIPGIPAVVANCILAIPGIQYRTYSVSRYTVLIKCKEKNHLHLGTSQIFDDIQIIIFEM